MSVEPPKPAPTFSTFWRTPGDWAPDTAENVFLARAIDRIGRAMFPEWEGPEFGVEPAPVIPPWPQHYPLGKGVPETRDALAALTLARTYAPQIVAGMDRYFAWLRQSQQRSKSEAAKLAAGSISNAVTTGSSFTVTLDRERAEAVRKATSRPAMNTVDGLVTQAVYDEGRRWAAAIDAAGEPYRRRASAVERAISTAAASGQLVTVLKGADLRFYYCHAALWSAPRAERWPLFETCTLATSLLYVETASLRAFLDKLAAERVGEGEPWWWRDNDTAKSWLGRREVQAEALRRIGDRRTREAYRGALGEMHEEHGGSVQFDSITRTLRDDATRVEQARKDGAKAGSGLYPDDLQV